MKRNLLLQFNSDEHWASVYEAMRRMTRQLEIKDDFPPPTALDRGLLIAAICREYLDRPNDTPKA